MTCFFTDCIDFIEGFYLFIILDVLNYAIYGLIFPLKLHFRFAILFIINAIMCLISYYYVCEKRKSFFHEYNIKKTLKWYRSVIENINSGFISIAKSKINYINKSLIALLIKDTTREIVISNLSLNGDEDSNILNDYSKIYDFIGNKLTLMLNELFEGIKFKENYFKIENKNNYESAIVFLQKNKDVENFICLGSKSIYKRGSNSLEYYEVFGRCYYSDGEEEIFEFIFNDVTKIKLDEEINADYKYKTIFLSKLAHEFKNPILCIVEHMDQISDKVANLNSLPDLNNNIPINNKNELIEDIKEVLLHVKHMSDYLIILVKNMDFFSLTFHSANVELKLNKEMVYLQEILLFCKNITITLIKKYLKEENLKFYLACNNIPLKIYTDEARLKQLLINLLSNSVKYTNYGYITLRVDGSGDKLRFDVRDTGKGLTESQQARLISGDESTREITKLGTGLGLSVVKDILDLFESNLVYEANKNQGSIFSFSIDVCNHSAQDNIPQNVVQIDEINENDLVIPVIPSAESKDSNSSILTLKKEFLPSDININLSRSGVRNQELPSIYNNTETSNLIIISNVCYTMVVDDDTAIRNSSVRLIKNYFESLRVNNFVILEASDGIECLYLFFEYQKKGINLSVIISDETMNYMNGSECAKILSEVSDLKELKKVPFFMLTAYESFNSVLRKGVIKAYTKPMTKSISDDIFRIIGFK